MNPKNIPNFQPNDEEERRWIESYTRITIYTSEKLRALSEEKRLPYLRVADPSDLSLMHLYLIAIKNDDHEISKVANALLLERGIQPPN